VKGTLDIRSLVVELTAKDNADKAAKVQNAAADILADGFI
jgi:hypothetical protein